MDAITLLHTRNSAPRLTEPAPTGKAFEAIMQAALRAPDHARLKPFRFLTVQGPHRNALGELFVRATNVRNGNKGEEPLSKVDAEKLARKPLRAPLIIVVVSSVVEHYKVPQVEQLISAGCAAHGVLLAAHAQGFGAIWRTGSNAFDQTVNDGLGLSENESIVGFIYVGTVDGSYKPLLPIEVDDYCEPWNGR